MIVKVYLYEELWLWGQNPLNDLDKENKGLTESITNQASLRTLHLFQGFLSNSAWPYRVTYFKFCLL